jgi:hypothetical protein
MPEKLKEKCDCGKMIMKGHMSRHKSSKAHKISIGGHEVSPKKGDLRTEQGKQKKLHRYHTPPVNPVERVEPTHHQHALHKEMKHLYL